MIQKKSREHIGRTFGRLTIIELVEGKNTKALWRCACGATGSTDLAAILRGNTQSCGCLRKEKTKELGKKTSHGKTNTRVYQIWYSMKARCQNAKSKDYARYGARGITLCPEWNSFTAFFADMGEPPKDCSLDRIDNNAGYSKENCRWATAQEQGNNRRTNVRILYNDTEYTIAELSRVLHIDATTIGKHLKQGWTVQDIIACAANPRETEAHSKYFVQYEGERIQLKKAAEHAGINYTTILSRLSRGWSIEKSLPGASHLTNTAEQ